MKRVLTAAEMRAVDVGAAAHGMPASVLMENAGEALARIALDEAASMGRFFVLCGPGNNGGDGLVAARKLAALGRIVFVELLGNAAELKGDAARNLEALEAAGLAVAPIDPQLSPRAGDVVVDALLGTGLSRAPTEAFAEAISRIAGWRENGARVVSADIPSGVPLSPSVEADVTVTFGYPKLAQVVEPGASRCGALNIADIGIPCAAEDVLSGPQVFLLEESDVRGQIRKRRADSHKGTYGHVLVVGGSIGKTGAAALAALGALRGGAGLVTVATRSDGLSSVLQHAKEVMGLPLEGSGPLGPQDLNSLLDAADGKAAVVFGPGIGRGKDTHTLLGAFLEELGCPCVLDADGLNALSGHLDILQRSKSELLLTPHPGEMSSLVNRPTAEVQANRVSMARDFAKEHHVVLMLKGSRTLIARDDGTVFVNVTGNAGMATGGTGDVLAGLCGALLAQGLSTENAALVGAWAHGAAGDFAKQLRGETGLIASDVLDGLGQVWARWER